MNAAVHICIHTMYHDISSTVNTKHTLSSCSVSSTNECSRIKKKCQGKTWEIQWIPPLVKNFIFFANRNTLRDKQIQIKIHTVYTYTQYRFLSRVACFWSCSCSHKRRNSWLRAGFVVFPGLPLALLFYARALIGRTDGAWWQCCWYHLTLYIELYTALIVHNVYR